MVRNYKRKTVNRWTYEDLLGALHSIRNDKLKINEASTKFGISRATLYRRYQHFKMTGCQPFLPTSWGNSTILSPTEERILSETIQELRKNGFTVPAGDVKRICYEYCVSNGVENKWRDKRMASDDWYYGFLKRNPGAALPKPVKIVEEQDGVKRGGGSEVTDAEEMKEDGKENKQDEDNIDSEEGNEDEDGGDEESSKEDGEGDDDGEEASGEGDGEDDDDSEDYVETETEDESDEEEEGGDEESEGEEVEESGDEESEESTGGKEKPDKEIGEDEVGEEDSEADNTASNASSAGALRKVKESARELTEGTRKRSAEEENEVEASKKKKNKI